MKLNIKLLLVGVAMALTATGSCRAAENPNVKIKILDKNSFALFISALKNYDVKIAIVNEQGIVLTEQAVNTNETVYARKYNLADLQNGHYLLEIKDNTMTRSYPIEVNHNGINILENKMVATFKPVIKQDNRMVDLMVFSPTQQASDLIIYDKNYEVVHDEQFETATTIQKKFDFTAVAPGDYSMVINTQGHKYTYSIPVK